MIENKDWYMKNEDDFEGLPELLTPEDSDSEG